ncbi:MAG: MotA/TolQ/ExbB proton channel family protein [Campylobacterota bacterium]
MLNISKEKISPYPRFLMILSLPLILYISLFAIKYFELMSLQIEIHSLIIISIILFIFLFFIRHNAWYAFSHFYNGFDKLNEKVEIYLNENQLTINGVSKSYGNIDSFFNEKLQDIRNDNFASVAASIFPTLGILGTFIAIAISMPDFSVGSKEALESEITILLSGIATAFYASIFGIFLSIWWIFFEKRGLTKIEKYIIEAKQYYKSRIWDKEEIKLISLVESKNQNRDLLEKIDEVITPNYIQTLDNIAKQKLQTIENINKEHEVIQNNLMGNYERLIELFENSTTKQKKIIEDFKELHEIVLNTNKEQVNNSKAVKNEIYTVLSSFQLVSSDLKELGKDLINHDKKSDDE